MAGFYYLLYMHIYSYCVDGVMAVVKKRLGDEFGLVWTAVGVIIGYNVLFNHTMACWIKAGGPSDLVRIEGLRDKIKQRAVRKEFIDIDDDQGKKSTGRGQSGNTDRYEGISS